MKPHPVPLRHPSAPPALYVHIPFCLSRCAYCAFASGIYDERAADAYIQALAHELSLRNIFASWHSPSTVFIGGGTPSSLSRRQLSDLLAILPLPNDGSEITCELNPDSVDRDKLSLLCDAGVNRISFGVQTLSARGLRLLERRHDAKTAIAAIREAAGMAFKSISIDLITAWPDETETELLRDLQMTKELGVSHVSCYNLMYEEGSRLSTFLSDGKLRAKKDDEVARFWLLTEGYLESVGFQHYETSNFSLPGFQCRHNADIWKGKEYLGIGASAHSYLAGRRFANISDSAAYVESLAAGTVPEVFSECLEGVGKARECAVFWLRLYEGINMDEFSGRTGWDIFKLYEKELPPLLEKGYVAISENGENLFVPRKYQLVLDSILVDLV